MSQLIRTNVSQAFWCVRDRDEASFKEAYLVIDQKQGPQSVSWFDQLFEGGIFLPTGGTKPLTFLITGPPGSGKTMLALELCYRLAKNEAGNMRGGKKREQLGGLFSLYISTEQETKPLIGNAQRFGFHDAARYILPYQGSSATEYVAIYGRERFFKQQTDPTYGVEEPESLDFVDIESPLEQGGLRNATLEGIVQRALRDLEEYLSGESKRHPRKAGWLLKRDPERKFTPDIMVVDSLNIIERQTQEDYFQKFLALPMNGIKMIIFILDAEVGPGRFHEVWEYVSDVVIRMDYDSTRNYFVRSIEVVKTRYQGHILGKHQIKIYGKGPEPTVSGEEEIDAHRRYHPFRTEGGIFIYPSIHFYLSLYKRRGLTQTPRPAATKLEYLNRMLGGIPEDRMGEATPPGWQGGLPEGRCTAFIGSRGGHKSHLGYLHLLNRIIAHDEAALIISLREEERMTRKTMARVLGQEFTPSEFTPPMAQEEWAALNEEQQNSLLFSQLDLFEMNNQLEVLYYHPGYITPEEFFHRMFISIHRLKKGRKLTVLFNSLDQIGSRFPLCAKQEIFIPGIIEALSGLEATSIFIAVEEPGQPAEQYGLLAMADLILSFHPYRFSFSDYYAHVNAIHRVSDFARIDKAARQIIENEPNRFKAETVVQVVRFAGGQRAGARGLLELVSDSDRMSSIYPTAGLQFTPLSSKYGQGKRLS